MFENDLATFDGNVLRIKDGIISVGSRIWENIPGGRSYGKGKSIEVMIPDSVEEISTHAFSNSRCITKLSIPNSVISLSGPQAMGTFEKCTNLEEIELSDKLLAIPSYTFYYCYSLKKIIIPNRVISIGIGAFMCCERLGSIVIPDSVKVLGDTSFDQCSNLKEIKLSNKLQKIGSAAFMYCTCLKSIIIPNSVETLDDNIFWGCSQLKEIKVPRHLVEKYGEEYIKSNTNAVITAYDGIIIEENTIETQNKTTNQPKTSSIKSYNGVVRRNLIADKRRKAIKSQNGDSKK